MNEYNQIILNGTGYYRLGVRYYPIDFIIANVLTIDDGTFYLLQKDVRDDYSSQLAFIYAGYKIKQKNGDFCAILEALLHRLPIYKPALNYRNNYDVALITAKLGNYNICDFEHCQDYNINFASSFNSMGYNTLELCKDFNIASNKFIHQNYCHGNFQLYIERNNNTDLALLLIELHPIVFHILNENMRNHIEIVENSTSNIENVQYYTPQFKFMPKIIVLVNKNSGYFSCPYLICEQYATSDILGQCDIKLHFALRF